MRLSRAVVQHVTKATKNDPDSESALLDLIPTHYVDDVANLHYIPPLGKSDHAFLTFDFHITVSHDHASVQSRPNIWKANIPDIMHLASLVDCTIDPESSVETAWEAFRNSYLKVTTPHIPWTIPRGLETPHHVAVGKSASFSVREEKCGIDLAYWALMKLNPSTEKSGIPMPRPSVSVESCTKKRLFKNPYYFLNACILI
ncbi:unnamed protein product [Schistosoma margrebowiei]|uniref:Uncharacterized protein n=1 Tax=Schistosoma margrebowiei TaxID=48269 RepID=A0A183M8X5_9TREM|nr:unnamed protein product [Schistosoma margrebowiei]